MTRTKVERGVYRVGSCSCGFPKKRHDLYDVVVGSGRDPITGKYRQTWKRHHGNLTTARDVRRDLLGQSRAGELNRTTATLGDLFDRWLGDLPNRDAAPRTVKSYRASRGYWKTLDDRSLDKITRADVRAVATALAARGVSNGPALAAISAAFSWAVENDWLPAHQDPTKKIRRTAKVNRLPQVPTPAHVKAVLEEARRYGTATCDDVRCVRRPEMERFVFLGAVTGCRSSELRGLRISDVDLDGGVVELVRAMSAEVPWTLKNRTERPIGLDAVTVEVVRAQVAFMEAKALTLDQTLRPSCYLFSDDLVSHWQESMVTKYTSTLFDHAAREKDRCTHRPGQTCPDPGPLAHFTFMSLRKFMDTYAQNLGFTDVEAAARAGHDPSVARKHYTGVIAEKDRALSAGLAGLLS